MNKTGSSAIQGFFSRYEHELQNFGILYPQSGRQGIAHYGLSRVLGFYHGQSDTSNDQESARDSLKHSLSREIESSGVETVVLSSENFVIPRSAEVVKAFLSSFDVRVVVYLRRHDAWWESAYAQAVKMVARPPWGPGPEEYVAYHQRKNPSYGNYRTLLDRWEKVFGTDNILVRPYETQQNGTNVVVDFLSSIGHEDVAEKLATQSERVNERLGPSQLTMLDLYQRLDVSDDIRSRLLQHAKSMQVDGVRRPLLPPGLRRQLIEQNLEDYAYIAKKYLGREHGILFYDPLPDPEDDWIPPDQLSAIDIVQETLKALGLGRDEI